MGSKKKKKIILSLVLILFCSIIGMYLTGIITFKKDINIDKILDSKNYSYLSLEAKAYLRGYYEETGEILLTEKNKKENVPYLNPQYVEYLSLSNEEQKEYGFIPQNIIIDYVYGSNKISEELPSTFNLTNVNGKNFVTPPQDQFGGLCWAYSSTAQVESLLLLKNDVSYSSDTTIFSERQLDYATSKNGIIGDYTLYPYRLLYDEGGAYDWPWNVEVDGLGLVDISWEKEIQDSTKQQEAHNVYNFNNSLYEVDGTVNVPSLNMLELDKDSETDMAKRKEYLDTVKGIIKNYGGAVAGSISPTGNCSISSGNTRLIFDNDKCTTGGAHAMQMVGWDDNYEYTFCENSNSISNNIDYCPEENIVKGKGVWILKNSWGEDYFPYLYLAYDSSGVAISAVTKVDTKTWDNYYHASDDYSNIIKFKKEIDSEEKIDKIKFKTALNHQNLTFDIYVALKDDNYQLVDTIETTLPGYYTSDLSDKNLISSQNEIKVKIKSGNTYIYSSDDKRIYTSNVTSNSYIETEDYTYENQYSSESKYEIRVKQTTKGIDDGSNITYKILDSENNEITANYSYEENIVFANKIFPRIIIDATLEKGTYKLQTLYNDVVKSESEINILGTPVLIKGDGSKENPYIINTPEQLNLIRTNRFAYYELGNDIDLRNATQNKDGAFYNNGLGWEPIEFIDETSSDVKFAGSLDGKGFKIKGLYINRPKENYVGLFKNLYSYGDSDGKEINISNLTLENPNIIGNDYVGGIAGNIDSRSNIYLTTLQNLYVIGGQIKGNNYVGGIAGKLKAGVYYDSHSNRIHSLFNSSIIVAEDYAGGIFGHIENAHSSSGHKIFINNIINIGTVSSNGNASGLIGNTKMTNYNPITISNAINLGDLNGVKCSNAITCPIDTESKGTLHLNDIYYINEQGYDSTAEQIIVDNVVKMNPQEIYNSDNYIDWKDLSKYWKFEVEDGINRMPYLKNMNTNYMTSSIDKVILTENGTYDLIFDIYHETETLDFSMEDITKADVDGSAIIKGKDQGKTYLCATSSIEKLFLPVYVVSPNEYTISFDANDGIGTMEDLISKLDKDKTLPNNTFTKEGYKFVGWNTKSDGSGMSYEEGQTILDFAGENESIVLYAQWEPITYNIVFNSNDKYGKTKTQVLTYDKEENLLINSFNNYNFDFIEWNTKSDGTGTKYTNEQVVKNLTTEENTTITLYAQWTTYTVTFNANGGTGIMDNFIIGVKGPYNLPTSTFVKDGYRLLKWNTKSDGSGTSYSKTASVYQNLNLYAIWGGIEYIIQYYDGVKDSYKNAYITYDKISDVIFMIYNGTKIDGYKFKAWNTEKDGSGTSYEGGKPLVNLTTEHNTTVKLYPQFEPITYNIVFHSNDGKNNTNEQALTYDIEESLNNNLFTKDGYKFVGWNTKSDGTGTKYANEQMVKNLTTEDNSIVNLYAMWEETFSFKINKYTVDDTKKYINKIDINTTVDDFKKNIDLNIGYSIDVSYKTIDGKNLLYTGSYTKFYKNNNLIVEYTNIIRGDITGDGIISLADLSKFYNYYQGNITMNELFELASDVNNDGKFSLADLSKFYNYYQGNINKL